MKKLFYSFFIFIAIATTGIAAPSTWVFYDASGHLAYKTWGNGNRIMDFSTAGYMGGGVALPTVATVKTLSPSGGDDKTAIQNAINAIAAMPLVNGFRGALQLSAGTFKVSGQLNITASGVVVRGAGSGSGGTVIVMNNSSSFTLFNVGGSGSLSTSGKVNITDSYVPSGTNGFNVSDASGFNVGDNVSVGRTVTDAWLHFIGMDALVRNGAPQTWISAGTVIRTDRKIKAISGNHITLDAPLTDSFDQTYLGSPVGSLSHYSFSGRVSQIGLEHFKIQAPAVASGYTAIDMDVLIDSWARDISIVDGVNNVNVGGASKRITLDSISITHTVDQTSTAAPCDYASTGTQVLLNKCKSSGHGSWPYITRSKGCGPIVLLNCSSTQDRGVAPHERWTTGILTDSSQFPNAQSSGSKEGVAYSNRGTDGSGQGWDTGWSVGWNVTSPFVLADAAPGTESWCIGCVAAKGSSSDPHGIYESLGTKVDLGATDSLYLEQLRERLGDQALANIGYGSASPDFSLSASPASVSIAQGQSGTSTVTETDLNGYTGTVSLSASGLPSGVTATFNPASTTNTSTLTLTASSTAATGTATITVTGTDGTLTHTTTVTLTVNVPPDFSISATPSTQTVIAGNGTSYTVNLGSINGFNNAVGLSISGLPTGVTASFNPASVNPVGSSTLTITTTTGAAAGTYTLTITGTSGSVVHSTTVSLTVNPPPPNFSLSASPSSVTIIQGQSDTSTISVTDINGYAGTVNLSASGLPAGVTASFNPSSTSTSSTLTLTASGTAATGTATVTITGTDGTLTHTTTVTLTVNPAPDFSLSASPNSLTVIQGSSGTSTVSVADLNGFSGSVSLSASGLPAGVTASFNPASTTGTSTLTLTADSAATTGTATVTVTGTSGSLTHTTTISLTINPPNTLPAGWTDADIGAVGMAGDANFNAGTFTINGSGTDIFNTGDQFNYVSQPVSGDLTIIARVVSESQTAGFSKAGVMIRESLATNSIEACVVMTPTNGVAMEVRPATGAATINMTGWIKGPVPPQWVKLVRVGGAFTGYYSADGSTWTQIAATNIMMAAGATAGLAVTAHNNAALNTATLDNVSIANNPFVGIFKIQNVASGLVLNNQGSLTNGSKITQWTATTTSSNLDWTLIPTSNGYYQINSLKSGKDAVVQGASTAAGAGIVQWDFGTSGDDQWKPVANGDGSYTFFNLHSGMVLGDPGASTSTSTQMDHVKTSNGGSNQKWRLIAP